MNGEDKTRFNLIIMYADLLDKEMTKVGDEPSYGACHQIQRIQTKKYDA
jgi:hypothetical protein